MITYSSILYNSGIIIKNESHLSTLAVFFDYVCLPAISTGNFLQARYSSADGGKFIYLGTVVKIESLDKNGSDPDISMLVKSWEIEKKVLFDEGVLSRINHEANSIEISQAISKHSSDVILRDLLISPPDICFKLLGQNSGKSLLFHEDYIRHLLRTDLELPSVYRLPQSWSKRELVKSILAEQTFNYILPQLSKLNPEQIIEVRKKVAPVREGFSYHLQSLSANLNSAIESGESIDNVIKYAKNIVETNLIPDYKEFCRQLRFQGRGWWDRILNAGDQVLEIDSAPWTPKFYKSLIQALGGIISQRFSEKKDSLTNRSTAFNFINTIDRKLTTWL